MNKLLNWIVWLFSTHACILHNLVENGGESKGNVFIDVVMFNDADRK